MSDASSFERLLRRDRLITSVGAALLCLVAWLWLLNGAGLGMNVWEMTSAALHPDHRAGASMNGMDMSVSGPPVWSPRTWVLMTSMWWIMMIAMMTPSAAPTILLFARVYRHSATGARATGGAAPTGWFAAGYLAAWLVFSAAATVLTFVLQRFDLVTATLMGSQSRWLSGSLLIAAGLYQLSPLKDRCLAHCRSPAAFLSQHWRAGIGGAFRLGFLHGVYCVGCCWLLMALLFVGGVMNLIWIAALALIVLIEKLAPGGRWLSRGAGAACIIWGAIVFIA